MTLRPDPNPMPAGEERASGVRRRRALGAFVAVLLAVLAAPPVLLLRARDEWLKELEVPAVQEDWEDFRRDMGAQSGRNGPVQRKVPKSAEPPLRVWLRDYLGLAIAAWLILGGTLGGFLGMMVVGALSTPTGPDGDDGRSQGPPTGTGPRA